jgi:Ni/Co efflux regulator RcnB
MSYPILSTLVVVAVLATMITDSVYPKAKNNDDDDDNNDNDDGDDNNDNNDNDDGDDNNDNNDNMKPKASAIQNGEYLDTENEGVVGSDVDCVEE